MMRPRTRAEAKSAANTLKAFLGNHPEANARFKNVYAL